MSCILQGTVNLRTFLGILISLGKALLSVGLNNSSEEEETWFIDGGNWASKKDLSGYNIPIGHIKNCLEFLNGRQPKWRKTE